MEAKPVVKFGLLDRTTTYLVGHMQYGDGSSWRNRIKEVLEPMGVRCFDPYHKPFVHAFHEDNETRTKLLAMVAEGNFEPVIAHMKQVRGLDLNMVDRCDFVIAYVDLSVPTCGTWEEIFWANRLKKPIYLVLKGGRKAAPLWLLGTVPLRYIFDDFDQVVEELTAINNETKEPDLDRWRLLLPDYR